MEEQRGGWMSTTALQRSEIEATGINGVRQVPAAAVCDFST
jgi:hypothetical protein